MTWTLIGLHSIDGGIESGSYSESGVSVDGWI